MRTTGKGGKIMLNEEKVMELNRLAAKIRLNAVRAIAESVAHAGHLGGSMSIAEVLAVLYGEVMNIDPKKPKKYDRDTLILSKGHSAPGLYGALAATGFFDEELLSTMNYGGTNLPSHADMQKVPGVDATAGSLGQGLSIALGIALANRLTECDKYSYCIIGDGEAQEGQIWEAAMYAAQQNLSHLIAFLDYNKKQLDGFVDDICSLGNPEEKFKAFGWNVWMVDGHDVKKIYEAVSEARQSREKPSMIILNTIKGKDALEFENVLYNHAGPITPEFYEALKTYFQKKIYA